MWYYIILPTLLYYHTTCDHSGQLVGTTYLLIVKPENRAMQLHASRTARGSFSLRYLRRKLYITRITRVSRVTAAERLSRFHITTM